MLLKAHSNTSPLLPTTICLQVTCNLSPTYSHPLLSSTGLDHTSVSPPLPVAHASLTSDTPGSLHQLCPNHPLGQLFPTTPGALVLALDRLQPTQVRCTHSLLQWAGFLPTFGPSSRTFQGWHRIGAWWVLRDPVLDEEPASPNVDTSPDSLRGVSFHKNPGKENFQRPCFIK